VRVAGLKRALKIDGQEAKNIFFEKPQRILDEINDIVIQQQRKFDDTWAAVQKAMAKQKVFIKTEKELTEDQQAFVRRYYEDEIESNIIPLLLDESRPMPYLRDKSLFLGIAMRKKIGNTKLNLRSLRYLRVKSVVLPSSHHPKKKCMSFYLKILSSSICLIFFHILGLTK